jgi:hypothetical protein
VVLRGVPASVLDERRIRVARHVSLDRLSQQLVAARRQDIGDAVRRRGGRHTWGLYSAHKIGRRSWASGP